MKNLLSKTKYLLLFTVLLIGSCEEKIDTEPLVLTEEIIFVSGEILRVTGRIVAVGQIPVSEHGFQIADNDSFNSPIQVSLGEKTVPGRFIGEYTSLSTGIDYFVRAFAIVDGTSIYGEVTQFTTLNTELTQFEPARQSVGSTVTIYGRNFTQDVEVYFGSKKATIVDFKFESVLTVRSPTPAEGEYDVQVRIISGGDELIYNDLFSYVTGRWTEVTRLPISSTVSNTVKRSTHFTSLGKVYYGPRNGVGGDPNFFLNYDFAQDQWDQTDFSGSLVARPFLFEGGHLGGRLPSAVNVSEFWRVDANGDFQLEGQAPFALNNGKSFKVGDELWVFGGRFNNNAINTVVYVYDFISKTWNFHDTAPIGIIDDRPAFEHNGLMYFVASDKGFWRYAPQTKAWDQISTYPGEFAENSGGTIAVNDGIGVAVGDYAYLGLSKADRNIWEYDINDNTWAPKTPHPSTDNDAMIGWYSANDRLYVIRTNQLFGGGFVLWELDPFTL